MEQRLAAGAQDLCRTRGRGHLGAPDAIPPKITLRPGEGPCVRRPAADVHAPEDRAKRQETMEPATGGGPVGRLGTGSEPDPNQTTITR